MNISPGKDEMDRELQDVRDLNLNVKPVAYTAHLAQCLNEEDNDISAGDGGDDAASLLHDQVIGKLLGSEHSGFRSCKCNLFASCLHTARSVSVPM